jgi:hypothetical protein
VARLSVWEESESGHTNNQSTFLFIAWVPTERSAYQSCFKVRVTPVLLFAQQKDYEESNTSEEYKFKHIGLSLNRYASDAYS